MDTVETLFTIPHIVSSISTHLSLQDLTNCARVNSSWHRLFSFELQRRDGVLNSHKDRFKLSFGLVSIVSRTQCSTRTREQARILNKEYAGNYTFSERLPTPTAHEDPAAASIETVAGGTVAEEQQAALDLAAVQQQQEEDATKIRATRDYWRGRLSKMMPLAHVSIFHLSPAENRRSLKNCILARILGCLPPTIISLDLRVLNDWREQDAVLDMQPFEPWDHPSLRTLRLDLGGYPWNNRGVLNWFLRRCPNLYEFRYKSQSSPAMDPLPGFDLSRSHQLEVLHLKAGMEPSELISTVHSARQLREFSMVSSSEDSGLDIWRTLQPHATTLKSIRLKGVLIPSPDIQSILQTSSRLEHFAVIENKQGELRSYLDVQDMFMSSRAWTCLGLKSLELHFSHGSRSTRSSQEHAIITDEALENLSAKFPKAHPDVLRVYLQLSLLTHLEFLKVFMIHPTPTTTTQVDSIKDKTNEHSLLGLDYSIESGLEILSPLKKLKRLEIKMEETDCPAYVSRIGQAEVEWMVKQWPELNAVHIGDSVTGPLKWLQEQRPGLEIIHTPRRDQIIRN